MAGESRVSTQELRDAAWLVRSLEERVVSARERRDDLIRKAEGSYTVREVSAICGISYSLVSRIQNRSSD